MVHLVACHFSGYAIPSDFLGQLQRYKGKGTVIPMYVMKYISGVSMYFIEFLKSALYGRQWLTSRSGHFFPREGTSDVP
jgi:hypothetical protein